MIDLSNCKPFAKGGNRHCFRHPDFPDRCVKVMLPGRLAELRARAPWYKSLAPDSHFDDNAREQAGYGQRVLRDAGPESPVWQHLPRYYGIHETSLGPGSISELLLDSQDAPAPTLAHYLQSHGLDREVESALQQFSHWLQATGVLTKNLLPHNIVVTRKSEQLSLYLIDGLGSAAALPLSEHLEVFRQRYIGRRIERMWKRIKWELSDRNIPWKVAERL